MNSNSLKFKVLEYLFDAYLENPESYTSIHNFLESNGISSEASIISFGYALKSAGFLKGNSSCNSNGEFMACIHVNGIDFISTAIKDETRKLIRFAIESEFEGFLPLEGKLELIPNNKTYAEDIAQYLKDNGLAVISEDKDVLQFKLTDLAHIIFNGSREKWDQENNEDLFKTA